MDKFRAIFSAPVARVKIKPRTQEEEHRPFSRLLFAVEPRLSEPGGSRIPDEKSAETSPPSALLLPCSRNPERSGHRVPRSRDRRRHRQSASRAGLTATG